MKTENINEFNDLLNYAKNLQKIFESNLPFKTMIQKIKTADTEGEALSICYNYLRARFEDPLPANLTVAEIICRIKNMQGVLKKLQIKFPMPVRLTKQLIQRKKLC